MAGKRIHMVEDEPVVAAGIVRKLEHVGFTVAGTTQSGEAALRAIDSNPPDLVLMDIKLQGELDGIETASRIRERYDVPVVFLTAYADEATIERAKQAEPYGYLVKPFTDLELAGALEIAIHRHAIDSRVRRSEANLGSIRELVSGFAFCLVLSPEPANDRLEWSIGSMNAVFGEDAPAFSSLLDVLYQVHPDDAAGLRDFAASVRGGSRGSLEFRLVGEPTRWVKLDARLATERSGRIRKVYGTFQDVTAVRGTLEHVATGEFSLDAAVHALRQGIWIGDPTQICVYANDALCALSGYRRDDIVGQRSLETLIGATPSDTSARPFEAPLARHDGEEIAVHVTPWALPDGSQCYLIVDLSEQHSATSRVDRARAVLVEAFQSGPVPSLLIDAVTHSVTAANDAFCGITGYGPDELLGAGWFGLAEIDELDKLNHMLSVLVDRREGLETVHLRARNGTQMTFTIEVRDIAVEGATSMLLLLRPTE